MSTDGSAESFVRVERKGNVAVVTLDRAPVNAVYRAVYRQIEETFDSFALDKGVHAVVFTGAGDRVFSAGVDLKVMATDRDDVVAAGSASDLLDLGRSARRAFSSLYRCAVPVVGAINGPAIGAGLVLAALCDVLIVSERATLAATEINVGRLGAYSQLQRLVGPFRARVAYLTGEPITAAELHAMGAAHLVVEPDALLDEAISFAQSLAAKSPIAVRLAKEVIVRVEHLPWEDGYRTEQDYTTRLGTFDDAEEARLAFVEKRDPSWSWR